MIRKRVLEEKDCVRCGRYQEPKFGGQGCCDACAEREKKYGVCPMCGTWQVTALWARWMHCRLCQNEWRRSGGMWAWFKERVG